jgi:hypothetical protein
MYFISKNDNDIVQDVYSNEVYLPTDISTFPITNSEFQQINVNGQNGNWQYIDGKLVPYIPAEQNKQTATLLLQATDWTQIPSVSDPSLSNPYLANKLAFDQYRNDVRQYAVYPIAGNITWPTVPTENWVKV